MKTFLYVIREIEVLRKKDGTIRKVKGGLEKIGISDDPVARVKAMQTGNPRYLHIELLIGPLSRRAAFALEASLHNRFGRSRVQGEWFKRRISRKVVRLDFVLAAGPLRTFRVPDEMNKQKQERARIDEALDRKALDSLPACM